MSKRFTLETKRFNIRWEMEGMAEILNLHLLIDYDFTFLRSL